MSLSDDSSIEEVAVVSFEEGRQQRLREAEAQNQVIDLADDTEDQKCLLLVSLPVEFMRGFKEAGFIEWFDDLLPVFEAGPADMKRFCEKACQKIRPDEDKKQVHAEEKGKNSEACNRSNPASLSSPAVASEGQESSVKDNSTDPHAPTSKSAKKSRAKTSTSKKARSKTTSKSSKTSRPSKKASKSKAKASASTGDQAGPQQQNTSVRNERKRKKPTSRESGSISPSPSSSSDESESGNSSSSLKNAKKCSRRKPSKETRLVKDAPSAPSSSTTKGRQSRTRKSVTKATGKSKADVASPCGGVKEQATSAKKRAKQPAQGSVSSKGTKNEAKRRKQSPAANGTVPQRRSKRGVAKDSYAEIGSSDIDSDCS